MLGSEETSRGHISLGSVSLGSGMPVLGPNGVSGQLEGGSTGGAAPDNLALDEDIKKTILRDFRSVGRKMLCVLHPMELDKAAEALKDWDLWGPLILSVSTSVALYFAAAGGVGVISDNAQGMGGISLEEFQWHRHFAFSLIYCFLVLGAFIVTVNTQLLGGKISIFQSLCILGYCLSPLAISACLNLLFLSAPRYFRLFLAVPAAYLSFNAAKLLIRQVLPPPKQPLAAYPVFLFYVGVASIVCTV